MLRKKEGVFFPSFFVSASGLLRRSVYTEVNFFYGAEVNAQATF